MGQRDKDGGDTAFVRMNYPESMKRQGVLMLLASRVQVSDAQLVL
jgi:hypothetical protein